MMTHHWPCRFASTRIAAALTVAALVWTLSPVRQSSAAELAEQAHSLRSVPANAAFYTASLRLKEQLDIFLESKAYAKLMEIPLIQLAKGQIEFQWQQSTKPELAQVREYIESPEGKQALAVLKEMFSDEIFLYGGADVAEWLKMFMEVNRLQRTVGLEAAATGEDSNDILANRMREMLEERADAFNVPTVVFGFRVQDAKLARKQLDEVHGLVRSLLDEEQPDLSAHLQRDEIAGHEFLTLRLDGSMIPWDKLREETEGVADEQFDQWRKLISGKNVALALGVTDEFVLLSVGASTDHLEMLGQGPFLSDQAAIKRLAKHADQRVVAINYLSEDLARNLSSPQQTVEDLADTVDAALQSGEVDDEQRKQLVDDIRSLDLSKYMPQPGETSSIAFLTSRGYEGFQYSKGTRGMLDSSKPLTILEHLGGAPMICVASRTNDSVENYDKLVAWLKTTAKHVEQIAETKADADDWAKYLKYRDRAIDLLKRVNHANREHLYPAFDDGQSAVAIDASAKSNRWFKEMPESPKPLPMLEIGLVANVSDAEQLRQGVRQYIEIVRDTIALLRDINPEEMPKFDLPEPERSELSGGGTIYKFPLPEEWGVDSQIALNAGLSDKTAVLSALPATTERLLKATPLKIDTALDLKRPAATVVHVEFKQMIETLKPWIDYGLDVATGTLKVEEDEDESDEGDDEDSDEETTPNQSALMMQLGFVMPQVHQLLDVATAMRSVTTMTYEEDGIWVMHSETHLKDLK